MKVTATFLLPLFVFLAASVRAEGENKIAVSEELKGRLMVVADGKVVDFDLSGDPEYFVLFHSASW